MLSPSNNEPSRVNPACFVSKIDETWSTTVGRNANESYDSACEIEIPLNSSDLISASKASEPRNTLSRDKLMTLFSSPVFESKAMLT